MGKRGQTASAFALFLAFVEDPTWTQSALAKRLAISVRAVRALLEELAERKILPLSREEDHPHVYWSVPHGWQPAGVALTGEEVGWALRLFGRMRRNPTRDRLIARLLPLAPGAAPVRNLAPQIADDVLAVSEDARRLRHVMAFEYRTAHSGHFGARKASVQHVEYEPRPRMVAVCHNDGRLKWFSIVRIVQARLLAGEPYRATEPAVLAAFLAKSLDGFASENDTIECVFVLRRAEAPWTKDLFADDGYQLEPLPDGSIRVRRHTNAIEILARQLVGLGDSVHAETPELVESIRRIAMACLAGYEKS